MSDNHDPMSHRGAQHLLGNRSTLNSIAGQVDRAQGSTDSPEVARIRMELQAAKLQRSIHAIDSHRKEWDAKVTLLTQQLQGALAEQDAINPLRPLTD